MSWFFQFSYLVIVQNQSQQFKQLIPKFVSIESMATKEQQLDTMLRQEQKNQLSSEQQDGRDQITSKSQFRKPIKNPFSDDSEHSDSDLQGNKPTGTPFMNKPPLPTKSALQQAQQQMKWDKNEQIQTEILTKLEGPGMKDKKIKQLASKYKALNIAYEKEKTQRKNLQTQLNNMMKTTDDLNKSSVSKKQKLNKSIEKTTSESCTNCQQNDKKIMDFRLKNQSLKSQLNKAMRVISRELGQDFNIDQVLNQDNGWKGRQQKIEKLKSRVKQLEDKLNNNGINVSHMSGFTAAQQTNNTGFNGTRTSALMAENKRKELDNLKIQVDALKSENEILQGKVKSLVSRKVILENEIKEVKADFEKKRELLIEKSNNDDKFIELLKNQNEKLKRQEKVVTKVIYKDENVEVTQLKRQVEMLRKKVRSLQLAKGSSQQAVSKDKSEQKEEKKVSKDLNSNGQPPRLVSAEKKKQVEEEYLKSNKYMNKMSSQEEQQLYKNWKNSINNKN